MALSITKELESTLGLAFAEAKARRHEHVTLEHLLYALLRDPVAARILRACGARLPELRRELEQHLDESQPSLPRGADREPEHTQAFKRVQRSRSSRAARSRSTAATCWSPSTGSAIRTPSTCWSARASRAWTCF